MTLNWLTESSFEIGGYTITLDYAIGGSKLKSSETSAGRAFPSLRPAAIIEDCSWSFEAAFQGSANGGFGEAARLSISVLTCARTWR